MKIDYGSSVRDKLSQVYQKLWAYIKTDEGKAVKLKTDKVFDKWKQKSEVDQDRTITRIADL